MSAAATMAGSGKALLLAAGLMQGDETLFWLVVALLATVVMFGTFCSYLLARHLLNRRRHETPDPIFIFHPFKANGNFSFPGDYPCRWLAIKTRQPTAVLEALQITKATPCSWEEGLARTFDRKLFVSPPVNGWIVVLGSALPDPAEDIDVCFRFLTQLSRKLGHVQFYNLNRTLSHHAWAVLDKGEVLRAYAWAGVTLWNQGQITPAEINLELQCLDYGHSHSQTDGRSDLMTANTEKVPLLAARWGMDPSALARCLTDERGGLTGELRPSKQV
jgi:hypothetical protein